MNGTLVDVGSQKLNNLFFRYLTIALNNGFFCPQKDVCFEK
jgi:hypothetical protein